MDFIIAFINSKLQEIFGFGRAADLGYSPLPLEIQKVEKQICINFHSQQHLIAFLSKYLSIVSVSPLNQY